MQLQQVSAVGGTQLEEDGNGPPTVVETLTHHLRQLKFTLRYFAHLTLTQLTSQHQRRLETTHYLLLSVQGTVKHLEYLNFTFSSFSLNRIRQIKGEHLTLLYLQLIQNQIIHWTCVIHQYYKP